MKKRPIWVWIILLIVLVISWIFWEYNRLVQLDEQVHKARSQVENVYQRRADLIPNIVKTVKGEAEFEKSTLTAVIDARASASKMQININDAEQMAKFQQQQGNLTQALGKFLMITENYPNLQTNKWFQDLRIQLEGSENRISVERKNYNEVTAQYNTKIRSVPTNMIAQWFGFEKAELFKATKWAEKAPVVEF